MKTFLLISVLALLSLACAKAEEAPAAPTPAPALEVKYKSTFTMEGSGRDPFWPIGWKPAAKANNSDHVGPEIPPSAFVVSAITLDTGGNFAIINGKVMQAGQQFGLQLGNQTYQLTVKAIEDGRVILMRRDEEIIVSLRRK